MAVDKVGMDVHVKLGDFTVAKLFDSLPPEPVIRTFVQYLIAFCSRPKAASDIISGVAVEQVGMGVLIKFCNSRSNRSRDITDMLTLR